MLDEHFQAERSALIVLDVQNAFLAENGPFAASGLVPSPGPDRPQVVAALRTALSAIRAAHRPVFFITTVLRPDLRDCYLAPPWRACLAENSGTLVEGSASARIIDELEVRAEDQLIVKKGHGAFQFTTLDRALAAASISTCVVAGNIHSAIDETVRQGGALGYETVLLSDACFPLGSPSLSLLRRYSVAVSTSQLGAWLGQPRQRVSEERDAVSEVDGMALLVIDMQNDFAHPNGLRYGFTDAEREEIIRNNQRLLSAARKRDVPVVYLRNVRGRASSSDSAAPRQGQREHGGAYTVEASWGAEIVDDLRPAAVDLVVDKRSNGGFATTHLHRALRNLGVETLIVTGGAVGGCIPATTLEGIGLGYRIIVAGDATYPARGRPLGLAALDSKVEVRTTDEALAILSQSAPSIDG